MTSLLFAIFMLFMVGNMAVRDARRRGIPIWSYVSSCFVIIAIAVGGSIAVANVLNHFGSGTLGVVLFVATMALTLVLCIWAAFVLFRRLERKYTRR